MAADIASSLKNWSTSEGSNQPQGATSIGTNLDDNLRMVQKVVRDLAARDTLASAATTDLGSVDETFITVSGTTTITSLGTVSDGIWKWVIFSGALTLTHNGTSLILPTAANITTAAGDTALFLSLGSGNWRCLAYLKASGGPVLLTTTVADGTVGAPGLAFSSDTDNGLYRIGANNWGISAGGIKVMEFNGATGGSATVTEDFNVSHNSVSQVIFFENTATNQNGNYLNVRADPSTGNSVANLRSASVGAGTKYFIVCQSNSGTDEEFTVSTNGNVASDGGTSMTSPADYAEMFEWADGNPNGEDRVGMSVALVGDRIRIATGADEPIGVVSGNPAVLADSGETRWNGKYVRDAFNRFVLTAEGERVLNPNFDPDVEYTPRKARKEWAPVGLVGKLRVLKGQQIGDRWILMRNISADVDEYLVR